ncbi:MAG: EspA/EspE family type VII secretion system effector [Mycolicibacterium sp.]|uniref:EspA/EspE family type VII secretion system effector n=1 Tax=Mycolicibacterium sp. TaxID=2320850 RepID=UPI003D0994DB
MVSLDRFEHAGKFLESSPGRWGEVAKAVKGAAGSPILDAGQAVIAGMRLTTGSGDPDRGDLFGTGSARFAGAGTTLGSAFPLDDWRGSGAQAYATANRRQSSRIESMAALDRNVQKVIAREAHQIAYHRAKLDEQSDRLADLAYLTWPIALIPGVGRAMKAAVELAAVNAALSICSIELYQLSTEAGENAQELGGLADEYSGLIRESELPDLDDPPALPPSTHQPPETGQPDQRVPPPDTRTRVSDSAPSTRPSETPKNPVAQTVSLSHRTIPETAARVGGVAGTAQSPAPATEMMSGIAPAFGAVGGMIGSLVAPLAAALTGAVGMAGQSLATLTESDIAATDDATREQGTPESGTQEPEATDWPDDPGSDAPGSDAPGSDDDAAAPPSAEAGTGDDARQALPGSVSQPEQPVRPTVPPAATRPPE